MHGSTVAPVILRRFYLYVVCAVSLGVLAFGVAGLGFTALYFAFRDPSSQVYRSTLGGFTAAVIVAGVVWGVHFWFARRYALRDTGERASAIRHAYLYAACFAGSVGATLAINAAAAGLLRPLIDACTVYGLEGQSTFQATCTAKADWEATAQAASIAVVLVAMWAFHMWVAARDRAAVGESRVSTTIRRWYMYAALLIGVLIMLAGLSQALEVAWEKYVESPIGNFRYIGDGLGWAFAGLLLWAAHGWMVARRHISEDRHSTLRALEGFIVLAVSIASALTGVGSILYYLIGRVLGVPGAGGIDPKDVLGNLAAPGSRLLVFGVAWVLVTRRLTRDAGTQEADRQAAIRRLYTNLVCLVGVATWGAGAAILLGTLAEQAEARIIGVTTSDWRDSASLGITSVVIGLAVWLAYWRHSPWAEDRQSFSRRAYVWVALLGSVLAVLAGGVGALATVLAQLFSVSPQLNDSTNLAFGQSVAVMLVAAGIGAYHWRVLRADAKARPAKFEPKVEVTTEHPPATEPPRATEPVLTFDPHSRRYTLVVSDATEDDIHQALATLPPQASYRLTPGTTPNGH